MRSGSRFLHRGRKQMRELRLALKQKSSSILVLSILQSIPAAHVVGKIDPSLCTYCGYCQGSNACRKREARRSSTCIGRTPRPATDAPARQSKARGEIPFELRQVQGAWRRVYLDNAQPRASRRCRSEEKQSPSIGKVAALADIMHFHSRSAADRALLKSRHRFRAASA